VIKDGRLFLSLMLQDLIGQGSRWARHARQGEGTDLQLIRATRLPLRRPGCSRPVQSDGHWHLNAIAYLDRSSGVSVVPSVARAEIPHREELLIVHLVGMATS
jgi:hypothetical protein